MTAGDALREGARILGAARDAEGEGSETPFLDASLLLADILGMDRARLLASGPDELGPEAEARYRAALAERASGRPVAYILGRKEFYGRSFLVDERVLVPRPDTELLVEAALAAGDELAVGRGAVAGAELARGGAAGRAASGGRGEGAAAAGSGPGGLRVHEACVGSGCVAISLCLERPAWEVSASDISKEALAAAARNAAALVPEDRPGGPLRLLESDLLSGVQGPFDIVVANPPYVPTRETDRLLGKGWGEPRLALDGGEDGLDPYRRLVPEAAARLSPGGRLLLEAGEEQAAELRSLLEAAGFEAVRTLEDLAGRPRVTEGRKPWKS
ncbi:MAG TPA: HemK/PrmC family methyltransferase [Spirochaetia bacterium]|nr:HemK/PrmC family methyltransferase [Spirochaetia bacterium]